MLVPADSHTIQLFKARKHEGPVASRGAFRLDLNGTYTSPWNKRAAVVFASAFVASNQFECKSNDLIEKKFINHIRTIRSHYLDFLADEDETAHDPLNTQANRLRTVLFWPSVYANSYLWFNS